MIIYLWTVKASGCFLFGDVENEMIDKIWSSFQTFLVHWHALMWLYTPWDRKVPGGREQLIKAATFEQTVPCSCARVIVRSQKLWKGNEKNVNVMRIQPLIPPTTGALMSTVICFFSPASVNPPFSSTWQQKEVKQETWQLGNKSGSISGKHGNMATTEEVQAGNMAIFQLAVMQFYQRHDACTCL